ncbi:MAG: hypothetical protein ABI547_11795 [Betaproteobacteria bacterium]
MKMHLRTVIVTACTLAMPAVFAALIRNDSARLGKVIRDAGIRAE